MWYLCHLELFQSREILPGGGYHSYMVVALWSHDGRMTHFSYSSTAWSTFSRNSSMPSPSVADTPTQLRFL